MKPVPSHLSECGTSSLITLPVVVLEVSPIGIVLPCGRSQSQLLAIHDILLY